MSALSRFFVEGLHAAGDTVALEGADARKIRTVLRLRTGDSIEIIDSAGAAFRAAVEHDGDRVRAKLVERLAVPEASALEISVAQSVPKGQKMDFVIEKLVELGVNAIIPLHSERSIGQAAPQKVERWRRIAKAAAAQSGRTAVPLVQDAVQLPALLELFGKFERVLFAWESAPRVPLQRQLAELRARRILLIIGPEGGFSHAEAEAARNAGAQIVWLGPRVLRTETAGLVLTAILNYVAE